jgi:hypothetical protein
MRKIGLAAIGAATFAAALALGTPGAAQQNGPGAGRYGPCGGPGMMYGYPGGYGPGMMWGGPGYGGPGYRGGSYRNSSNDLNLSVSDVRANFERMLSFQGNPHVKLGEVVAKDDNTITVTIVTTNGSLVQQYAVDRRTGFMRPE